MGDRKFESQVVWIEARAIQPWLRVFHIIMSLLAQLVTFLPVVNWETWEEQEVQDASWHVSVRVTCPAIATEKGEELADKGEK